MLKNNLSIAIALVLGFSSVQFLHAETPTTTQAPPTGQPPGPPPNGGGMQQAEKKQSATEGNWSFDITTQGEKKTATITYYSGKTDRIVAVPAVLGGAKVTKIAAQAFGHHSEILALYFPTSLETVEAWALYDLNSAQIISFANPQVNIATGALQSSANASIYLPKDSKIQQVDGNKIVKQDTNVLGFTLKNSEASAIAPGQYLNVDASKYQLTAALLQALAQSSSHQEKDVSIDGQAITFKGEAYRIVEEKVSIAAKLNKQVQVAQLNSTFKAYSAETAKNFNQQLKKNNAYTDVADFLTVKAGYYLNGQQVQLDPDVQAYDVKTGEKVIPDVKTGLLPSTGQGQYKYVAWQDTNNDGKIDRLYYSPFNLVYQYQEVELSSENANLNKLKARDQLNPQYLAFANAVLKAAGADQKITKNSFTAKTAQDAIYANQNRSILWANDYGTIDIKHLQAYSDAVGNWAKMSSELGLASPNTEIVMEWGMNALLYATNGGQISVGDLSGKTSEFYANGDGANGIVAGASGLKSTTNKKLPTTSSVTVKNAKFTLEGWNNHVADTVYGGYANLVKINATTGKSGSYAVGQSSALANDFGNGVVDAQDFHTTVYGNRSAGAYVIGGGVITAKNSSFTSKMDAGLVIASGGTYKIDNSQVTGQIAIRNRGGITNNSVSDFSDVKLGSERDIQAYTTGSTAKLAVDAWQKATKTTALAGVLMSRQGYRIADAAQHYGLTSSQTTALLADLSKIANTQYTTETLLRNSVLDNTFYNYSAGAYTGTTDFSDVPYLTVGSAFGGLVSALLEFESAGTTLNLNRITTHYTADADYQYLLASEAGSAPVVNVNNSQIQGLIWNEGDVNRVVEGQPGARSSKLQVNFIDSQFTGSFADGDLGLWKAKTQYRDHANQLSQLNGNYYRAKSNWQGKANFKKSTWQITHDSYLGELTLDAQSKIIAPQGYSVSLVVNGKVQKLVAGTYTGQVQLLLKK
ncbi:MAG: hypothetical protein QM666_02760 [Acinetobacter sp.]